MNPRPIFLLCFLWLVLAPAFIPSFRVFALEHAEPGPSPEIPPAALETPQEPERPPAPREPEAPSDNRDHDDDWRRADGTRFNVGQNSTLGPGEIADAVVSVFGSSTSHGTVRDAVVSVFGSSTSTGEVGEAVVSVFGDTRVTAGTVGEASVAVFGNNHVNGRVKGRVVAVFGDIELGPDAVVDGGLVCVGGRVMRDPAAIVRGDIEHVPMRVRESGLHGLKAWFNECLLYGRPLAFGPNLIWAWWIACSFLGLYLLIAVVTPEGIAKCVQTLETRPGQSIAAALLTMLLTPVVYALLAFTVFIAIGVALIPLFTFGLFIAGLFGKAVMLCWLGRRVARLWHAGGSFPVVAAVLVGGAIVLALYTVPFLGFVVYKALGILGLGVVIHTLLVSIRSDRRVPVAARAASVPVAAVGESVFVQTPEPAGPPLIHTQGGPASAVISAAILPRAGFWMRAAAALLDVIMVSILFGVLDGMFGWFFTMTGSFPVWFAGYNMAMWASKGTTIGGIICGLKVVRLDDRPLDAGIAIVRGLGAFLSLAVAGLGFIWVAFDDEKQSWHDKIAGTTIVLVPKGVSLL